MAEAEKLLQKTYKVSFPNFKPILNPPGVQDNIAVATLQNYQPALLQCSTPRKVFGDGNCLFRSVSLGLYGSQNRHFHLRLLTAIEISTYRHVYDTQSPDYVDEVKDGRVIVSEYKELLKNAVTMGAYCELLHIYALSAAISCPLKTYFPCTGINQALSVPYTRDIFGRGLNARKGVQNSWSIMWSQLTVPNTLYDFRPNHFVVLWFNKENKEEEVIQVHSDKESYDKDVESQERADDSYTYVDDINLEEMTKEESTNTREENMRPSVPESNGVLNDPEDILAENKLTPDEEVREYVRKLAHGHLDNSFLSTDKTLDLLRFGKPILEKVPLGPKDNMFFIIDNSSNSEKRRQNKQSNFLDDCGAWKSGGPTTKFIYHVDQSGKRTKIHLKEGKYCVERRIEKKNVYVPLDIQPKDSELLVLHRQYMTLKAPQQYQRRITWISSFPENEIQRVQEVALYEYRGTFPGGQPHGNCKDVNKIYKKNGNHSTGKNCQAK